MRVCRSGSCAHVQRVASCHYRDLRHCSGNFSSVHATEQCIIISRWSPVSREEALIHSSKLSRVWRARPPRVAHGARAHAPRFLGRVGGPGCGASWREHRRPKRTGGRSGGLRQELGRQLTGPGVLCCSHPIHIRRAFMVFGLGDG